jgi:hypothetical protein
MKRKFILALASLFILGALSTPVFSQTEAVEVTTIRESLGHQVVHLSEVTELLEGTLEESSENEKIYTILDQQIVIQYDTPVVLVNGEQETFLTSEAATGEVLPRWGYEVSSTDRDILVPVEFIERVLGIEIEEMTW